MTLAPTCDLVILTGEPSGDAYGAEILRALRQQRPDLVCAAMGGEHLRLAGAEMEHGIEGLAVMGLGPVLARLPEFIRLGLRLERMVRARRPKVVLTIDYPGLNLRLLRKLQDLRGEGTRFIHLVAPQVWAWKPRRAKRIAGTVDRLLCFFPFEPPLFNRYADRYSFQAEFVGHPLVDLVRDVPTDGLDRELGWIADDPVLMLAPGSRQREVTRLLSIFNQTVELALPRLESISGRPVRIAVARVADLPLGLYRSATHLPLIEGRYRELCARARCGLIASGTATLEAALSGLPHIIAYRTDRVTYTIARKLLLTEHVGLPNIVANERVVPEVLQEQCTPERLCAHLVAQWAEGAVRSKMLANLARTRSQLGPSPASPTGWTANSIVGNGATPRAWLVRRPNSPANDLISSHSQTTRQRPCSP
jgi:lipid-A-disaccharide synthase